MGIELNKESEKHGPGSQKRSKSVRFDSIQFDSYSSDMGVRVFRSITCFAFTEVDLDAKKGNWKSKYIIF